MATYNCSDSSNQAYGAGNYSTCDGTSSSVGAPDTGFFAQITSGGTFSILLPLAAAVIFVAISVVVVRRKRASK
jgi:hypothetical protein